MIRLICAWCLALIEDGPTDEHGRVSHGICAECRAAAVAELEADMAAELCPC